MRTLIALDCNEIQVSDCDWLFLVGYNWYKNINGYFYCSNGGVETLNRVTLHRSPIHRVIILLQNIIIPKGYTIDHIDGNKSNNQRENLRVASYNLNGRNGKLSKNNTSGFTGVKQNYSGNTKPWRAEITYNYKQIHLGCFYTKEEASEAYQKAKNILDTKEEQVCENLKSKENMDQNIKYSSV